MNLWTWCKINDWYRVNFNKQAATVAAIASVDATIASWLDSPTGFTNMLATAALLNSYTVYYSVYLILFFIKFKDNRSTFHMQIFKKTQNKTDFVHRKQGPANTPTIVSLSFPLPYIGGAFLESCNNYSIYGLDKCNTQYHKIILVM